VRQVSVEYNVISKTLALFLLPLFAFLVIFLLSISIKSKHASIKLLGFAVRHNCCHSVGKSPQQSQTSEKESAPVHPRGAAKTVDFDVFD
jgi:hypothetical protein